MITTRTPLLPFFFLFAGLTTAQSPLYYRELFPQFGSSSGHINADGTATMFTLSPYAWVLNRLDPQGTPLLQTTMELPGQTLDPEYPQYMPNDDILLPATVGPIASERMACLTRWTPQHQILWSYAYQKDDRPTAAMNAGALPAPDGNGCIMQIFFMDTVGGTLPYFKAWVRVDSTGEVLWAKSYPNTVTTPNVIPSDDGGYFGVLGIYGVGYCYFRSDAELNMQWYQLMGSSDVGGARTGVVQGVNGDLHVFTENGSFTYQFGSPPVSVTWTDRCAWATLDPNTGQVLSTRVLDHPKPFRINSARAAQDGNFFLACQIANLGALFYPYPRIDAGLMKITGDGDVLWGDSLRVIGRSSNIEVMHERDGLLFTTNRLSAGNYFHNSYSMLDTNGTTLCHWQPTPFTAGGPLVFPATPETPVVFTDITVIRTPLAMTAVPDSYNNDATCVDFGTAVTEVPTNALQVFPNPASERLTVVMEGITNATALRVIGMDGRVHAAPSTMQNGSSVAIDVSGLAPGCYVLEAGTAAEVLRTSFVKQ